VQAATTFAHTADLRVATSFGFDLQFDIVLQIVIPLKLPVLLLNWIRPGR